LSRPSEWPECQHSNGFSKLVSVMVKRKKSQCDKSGEYGACRHTVIWYTDKKSLMGNTVCGNALLFRQSHFPAAHNSGRWCRTLSCTWRSTPRAPHLCSRKK
jgi:hypothetical protein